MASQQVSPEALFRKTVRDDESKNSSDIKCLAVSNSFSGMEVSIASDFNMKKSSNNKNCVYA